MNEKFGVGKIFTNNKGYKAVIIGKDPDNYNKRYIKFLKTGNIIKVDHSGLQKGMFKDYDIPSVNGVGYSYKGAKKKSHKAYRTWTRMLERCYNPKNKKFHLYGGRGVKVSDRWLHFKFFEIDIKDLPGYDKWINSKKPLEYSLDKDIKGNGLMYSKDNCIFTTPRKQKEEVDGREVISISASGEERVHRTISQACRDLGVQNANVYKVLKGERKSTLGYKFKRM